jgi:hypothetical protein
MATLIVGGYDSKCGKCNKSADPNESGHFTQLGYRDNGEPGCGELWDLVSFVYASSREQIYSFVDRCPNLAGLRGQWAEYGNGEAYTLEYKDEILPGQMELPQEILQAFGLE